LDGVDRDDIDETYRSGASQRALRPARPVVRRVSGRAALDRIEAARSILAAAQRPPAINRYDDYADGPEAA